MILKPIFAQLEITEGCTARLDRLEFEVFKRFIVGISYKTISKELNDLNLTKKISNNLINKGLLI